MSAEELAGKFADCAQGLIADDAQRQVIETIYGLDEMESINSLTSLLNLTSVLKG